MIGIFDSGAGGLSVLREILKAMPRGEYVYFSDNAFCPYGEKTPEFIQDRARAITDMLIGEGCEIIVVACNTATAAAISTLRAEYPIPFIGMEPAVKPAALGTRSGVIGVLATAGTLKGSKYLKTKGNWGEGCKIVEHVGKGFVELVENLELTGEHAEQVVRESLQPLLDEGADTIVLGCTHYPFLLDTMKRIAPEGIRFIDPAPAVTRRLMDVMRQEGIKQEGGLTVRLLSSGSPDSLEKLYQSVI